MLDLPVYLLMKKKRRKNCNFLEIERISYSIGGIEKLGGGG